MADRRETDDRFGRVVTSADFDGDGFDDLAITSLEDLVASGVNVLNAGAANILYGSATGLEAGRDRLWTQDSPGILNLAEPGDLFGYAGIAADYDGDGRGDLALAVPREDLSGAPDAGAVAVLYGAPVGALRGWRSSLAPGPSGRTRRGRNRRPVRTGDRLAVATVNGACVRRRQAVLGPPAC